MIQQRIFKISELVKNRVFKLENDYEAYEITIPQEFLSLKPGQLWLIEHQITAFCHGFGLDNMHTVPIDKTKSFKYSDERKAQNYRIDPSVQNGNLRKYLSWLCDYKKNWTDYKEYDCHPQSFDEFLEKEKRGNWEERLLAFLMIVLLQNINGKNVAYTEKKQESLILE
ncbi:MAG: hypothetical protein V3U87_15795 [Methylococcaceae bacterium]